MKNVIKERINSFKYAFNGIKTLFKTEVHGKFHILFALFVVAASVFFDISTVEWCMVIICIAMVVAAEAFNSAIEALTDLASPEYHPLAGKAKDLAAGGVLICSIGALVIGFIIFLPKVLLWLGWLEWLTRVKILS